MSILLIRSLFVVKKKGRGIRINFQKLLMLLCWDFRESKGSSIPVSLPFTHQKKQCLFVFAWEQLGKAENPRICLTRPTHCICGGVFFLILWVWTFVNKHSSILEPNSSNSLVQANECTLKSLKEKKVTHLKRLSDLFSVNVGFFHSFFVTELIFLRVSSFF